MIPGALLSTKAKQWGSITINIFKIDILRQKPEAYFFYTSLSHAKLPLVKHQEPWLYAQKSHSNIWLNVEMNVNMQKMHVACDYDSGKPCGMEDGREKSWQRTGRFPQMISFNLHTRSHKCCLRGDFLKALTPVGGSPEIWSQACLTAKPSFNLLCPACIFFIKLLNCNFLWINMSDEIIIRH